MTTERGGKIVEWEKLRADLEELSPEQLKLVVELVEQMKKVNEQGERVDYNRNPLGGAH